MKAKLFQLKALLSNFLIHEACNYLGFVLNKCLKKLNSYNRDMISCSVDNNIVGKQQVNKNLVRFTCPSIVLSDFI